MSIPSWAVKGAKVVCVLDVPERNRPDGVTLPVKGEVYTIRWVLVEDGEAFIYLVEVENAVQHFSDGTREPAFHVEGYRPLVTRSREQDIAEHFAGHLHQRVPEKA